MGQAKRRGTREQRIQQKLDSQYGLTNHELAEAYMMNRYHDYHKLREKNEKVFNILDLLALTGIMPYKLNKWR